VSPSGTSFGSLHRRLRQQTVLRRLNTKHPPGKGPFAVRAAPVLSPWLPSVAPGSRGGGVLVSGAVRHVPPACSCAAGRPGEVSAPGLAVLLGPWWLPPWRGCGDPPGCCFPRSPSILHPTGAGAAQATPATTRRTLPPRKAPRKPGPVLLPPLPGRSGVTGILVSVTPDGAAPASNGRQRRPCRLLPCAAGFVQNPSSECPTTRLQSGTKHYGVYLANHDARAVLTRLESWR
jgi:hypothetical protein